MTVNTDLAKRELFSREIMVALVLTSKHIFPDNNSRTGTLPQKH